MSNKKVRIGLSFEIELSISFLSVTEDLHIFATVSKACRDAAKESYRIRINNSNSSITSDEDDDDPKKMRSIVLQQQPRVLDNSSSNRKDESLLECYKKPWWEKKEQTLWFWGNHRLKYYYQKENNEKRLILDDNDEFLEDDDDDDELYFHPPHHIFNKYRIKLLNDSHYYFFLGDKSSYGYDDDNEDYYTELVHSSVDNINNLWLLILCRWTNRGKEVYNTEATRKQLYVLIYKLPAVPAITTLNNNNTFEKKEEELVPIFFSHLNDEPLDRNNYGSLHGVYYGNAIRSRNGKVVAVVTALPLGNDDNEDDDEPRETAIISIYDIITNDDNQINFVKRNYEIEVPIGARTYESTLTMSIDNTGEYLSIVTTQELDEGGFWGVYQLLSSTSMKPIVTIDPIGTTYTGCIEKHYFTPDNEFVMEVGENIFINQIVCNVGLEEEGITYDNGDFNNDDDDTITKIPSYFLKRMIVIDSSK